MPCQACGLRCILQTAHQYEVKPSQQAQPTAGGGWGAEAGGRWDLTVSNSLIISPRPAGHSHGGAQRSLVPRRCRIGRLTAAHNVDGALAGVTLLSVACVRAYVRTCSFAAAGADCSGSAPLVLRKGRAGRVTRGCPVRTGVVSRDVTLHASRSTS